MGPFLSSGLFGLFVAAVLFVAGIPPICDVLSHYYTRYHPTARALKGAQVFSGPLLSYAVTSADKLGVFNALHKNGPMSVSELVRATGLSERGLFALCEFLASNDFLYAQLDGRFVNSATVEHHFVDGISPEDDMRSFARLMNSAHFAGMVLSMEASVKTGTTQLKEHAESYSHPWWVDFARETNKGTEAAAKSLLIHMGSSIGSYVLDVATGSGHYGFAAARDMGARVTLQDYANVLQQTRSNAETFLTPEVRQRLSYLPGDFFNLTTKPEYDTLLATNIVHHFSPQTSVEFFKQAARFVKPGGHVLVVDVCPPPTPHSVLEGKSFARNFNLIMLLWSKEGKAYNLADYQKFFLQSGWRFVKQTRIFLDWCLIDAVKE